MAVRESRVKYSNRAFEQDAEAAMRGDIVRALVELLTNSDDAYRGSDGEITVVVAHTDADRHGADFAASHPVTVSVHDSAGGLSPQDMARHFGTLGAQNEGFMAGQAVRGLLGRGAKDVAGMGEVLFESVHGGQHSAFRLRITGKYTIDDAPGEPLEAVRGRLRLAPEGSGLTAHVFVARRYAVPKRRELADKLASHVQLRHLVTRRTVRLVDQRTAQPVTVVVEARPVLGEAWVEEQLDLGSYGTVRLSIRRLPERVTRALSDYSEHGLAVFGSTAGYMNTLFGQEGRPESGWVGGEISAPQIDELIRAYDRGETNASNPQRLVSRDRDGLVKEHPFFVALRDACIRILLPLLDDLSKAGKAAHRPGSKLEQALNTAQRALAGQVAQAMREIDDEDPIGPDPEHSDPDLSIIPPRLVLQEGETRTLSVRVKGSTGKPFTASVTPDSPVGLVEIIGQSADFTPHPRMDCMVSNFTVRAGSSVGSVKVKAQCAEDTAYAVIDVVTRSDAEPEPVTELRFERATYTMAPNKGRNLRVMAPIESVGEAVEFSHRGGPAILTKDHLKLKPSAAGDCAECFLRVQSGDELGTAKLDARCSGQAASAEVQVKQNPAGQTMAIKLKLEDESSETLRAWVDEQDGTLWVRVYCQHPALRPVLGPYDDALQQYREENTPEARAVLAEVIGMALANFLVEREANRRPELGWDAARVLAKQGERSGRLIPVAQRALKEVTVGD